METIYKRYDLNKSNPVNVGETIVHQDKKVRVVEIVKRSPYHKDEMSDREVAGFGNGTEEEYMRYELKVEDI
ncbi:MAG: hypothetical protein HC778_00325 [Chamaesiphon sp. CSU_1_12]|nr:hypothetical protein [Chamaesiphon sp. CSU_1_12]